MRRLIIALAITGLLACRGQAQSFDWRVAFWKLSAIDCAQTWCVNDHPRKGFEHFREDNPVLRNATVPNTAIYFVAYAGLASFGVERLPKKWQAPAFGVLAAYEGFVVVRNWQRNPRTRRTMPLAVTLVSARW